MFIANCLQNPPDYTAEIYRQTKTQPKPYSSTTEFFFAKFHHNTIYINTADKTNITRMSSSKKLNCKGTLQQVFIIVYRLEIANFLRSVMMVFSTQLCDLYSPSLSLSPSLLFKSPPPCVKKYTV
jgi:hypothetical protein